MTKPSYGSGKSTVLEAIRLLLEMMFGENKISLKFYTSLLSQRSGFSLEYGFNIRGEEIIYNFSYSTSNDMIFERLQKNGVVLFERMGKDSRDYFETEEKVYEEKLIKQDGLFLRTLYFNGRLAGDSVITEWIEFLKNSTYITAAPTEYDLREFSSGFHSELENMLIKYFMEKSKNSQLILASHSTTILSNSVLRPDQEYAVEFTGKNGSSINRFSNMQPRNSQNITKMYLSGVFGGKPVYGENTED